MMMIMSSEPIAIVATLLNHAASHLTLISTELLNTLMILFLLTEALGTMLNGESGLSETSVAAWIISYDIGYMSSSTSRILECRKAINSATRTESNFSFYFLTKFDTHPLF